MKNRNAKNAVKNIAEKQYQRIEENITVLIALNIVQRAERNFQCRIGLDRQEALQVHFWDLSQDHCGILVVHGLALENAMNAFGRSRNRRNQLSLILEEAKIV